MDKSDGRYPWTYAADYIRMGVVDFDPSCQMERPTISRSQASQARRTIARALGMSDDELASKLADQYIADNKEST